MSTGNQSMDKRIETYLKELRLGAMRGYYRKCAQRAAQEEMGYEEYLCELLERESELRRQRRIERRLKDSGLPLEKNLKSFDLKRFPRKIIQCVKTLVHGGFLERKENILAFGKPGTGKTHLLSGIAQELIRTQCRKVLSKKCSVLVQELLRAKRDLNLDKELKKLSRYEVILIDDIGYVQHNREEMEVLFILLAERYERGSVMVTSNLPFSKWERIFKDPMTTAAAIDRLVHHSIILELNVPSYRAEAAKRRLKK